jgi:hypothetical protein
MLRGAGKHVSKNIVKLYSNQPSPVLLLSVPEAETERIELWEPPAFRTIR